MKHLKPSFKLLRLAIGIGIVTILVMIDISIGHQFRTEQRIHTQDELNLVASTLSSNIQKNIHIVHGLKSHFALNPTLSKDDYHLVASAIFDEDHQIRNIAAAPDYVIQYMYPIEGNEAAIGLDYRTKPEQFASVEKARTTAKLVLAGPLNLVQGGVGIISRIPIFLTDDHGDDYFWGLISAVIDAEKLYIASGLYDSELPLDIAIRGKDSKGSEGESFFGESSLFEQEHISAEITLPYGSWQMAARPKMGWQSHPENIWLIRSSLIFISFLLFALISSYLKALNKTLNANERFKYLLEESPVAYAVSNKKDQVTYLNKAFIKSFGYTQIDIPSLEDWWVRAFPDKSYRHEVKEAWQSYLEYAHLTNELPSPLEFTVKTKSGEKRTLLLSVTPDYLYHDEFPIVLYDITERKEAEEQLGLLSRVFSETHDGILITTPDGNIVNANPSFTRITGYSEAEVIGKNPNILSSGMQDKQFYTDMWTEIKEQGYWHGEVWNRKKNGELYAELLTISALKVKGQVQHYIGLFSDITKAKQQQESLKQIAHYDMLTGLPNRVLLHDRFTQAKAHSHRHNTTLAVCFLDLDDFKPVNDTYGHEIGDQLLVTVSKTIASHIRESDTVSRIGGDEFILLLTDLKETDECERLIKRLLTSLSQAFKVQHHSISISASCGIAFCTSDDKDLDNLMRSADQAMYQAKLSGKNRYQVYDAEYDQTVMKKQSDLDAIRYGLEHNQMQLYYQPKVNMKLGDVIGVEALIRWIDPDKGMIPPLEFLPAISGTELEITLGNWVVDTALSQLEYWLSLGIVLEVSVNISSYHLQSEHFISDLQSALARYPAVSSSLLQLEILESSALGDLQLISQIVKTCRNELGIHIALDDFGTGYSSLTHLRNLDVDTVKIDQTFVRDVLDDPDDFAIIDGVISLARSFGRDVIAEGVESTDHGLMLMTMGCEQAQGYGIAKPMPAMEVEHWLKQQDQNRVWSDADMAKLSTNQIQAKQLVLTTKHWLAAFKNAMTAAPGIYARLPIMEREKCHHSVWIRRFKHGELLDSDIGNKLDKEHEALHDLADKVLSFDKQNEAEKIRLGLIEMEEVNQRLIATIYEAIK